MKKRVATVGWPLLWAVRLDTDVQLETKTQVRKFKKELRLKNTWLSTTPLVLELADKVKAAKD